MATTTYTDAELNAHADFEASRYDSLSFHSADPGVTGASETVIPRVALSWFAAGAAGLGVSQPGLVGRAWSALVTGAAKAFGWVPGLGPKLEGAAAAVEGFKNSANDAMDAHRRRAVLGLLSRGQLHPDATTWAAIDMAAGHPLNPRPAAQRHLRSALWRRGLMRN